MMNYRAKVPAKPNWNKAKESRKGDLEVVEKPELSSGGVAFFSGKEKSAADYELE